MTKIEDCYMIRLVCPKCGGRMDFNAEDGDSSVGMSSCAGWGCEDCEFYIDFYDIMYKCEKCGKVNDGGYECKCEVVK